MPGPLPLFPLNTPLVPGLVLPLHVFEPRYRQLVADLLAEPDEEAREFGIIAVREGHDIERDGMAALYDVGVATVLREADPLPDGRYDIVTTGTRRFRLLQLDASAPLLRGEVEFLEDVTDPTDAVISAQVVRQFLRYRVALSGQVPDVVDVDEAVDAALDEDDTELPDDPTVLSYLVTAAMVIPVHERQGLLAADSTGERLRRARALLGRETALITALSAVPSLDLPGTPPSAN